MDHNWKAFSFRYGLALFCTLFATVVRFVVSSLLGTDTPFITYFPAVFVTAVLAGFGPTLLVVAVSVVVTMLMVIPPRGYLLPQDLPGWMSLLLFTVFGVGMAALGEVLRRRTEQIQREGERFSVTLASVGDGVIVTDEKGLVTFLNPIAEGLTGWTLAEAQGQPLDAVFSLINEDTRKKTESPVTKALQKGCIVGLANHTILIAKDGTERAIDDSAAPIRNRDGRVIGVVLVFRDVSDRRAADLVRGRLAALINSSEYAIVGKTFEGIITDWNAAAERLFGYSAEEAVGRPVFDLTVPPDRKQELLDVLKRIRQGGPGSTLETVRQTKEGRSIPISLHISPILDSEGNVVGASAIDRDISRQRAVEQRRNARLAVTQILAQDRPTDQAIGEILHSVCSSLGWHVGCFWRLDIEENVLLCQQFWSDSACPAEKFRHATLQARFQRGNSLPGLVLSKGEPVWISNVMDAPIFVRALQAEEIGIHGAFAFPVRIDQDILGVIEFFSQEIQEPDEDLLEMMATIGGQIGLYIDRKESEAALKDSERLYRAIGESIDYGVWVCDPHGRNIYASDSFLEMVGMTPAECSQMGWAKVLHPDDVEETVAAWEECVRTSGMWYREHRFRGADGEYHPVLARGVPVKDEKGQVICWAGINLDIRHLKDVENALREADRRKDEFLAMLSHELRNPLAPIRSGLDMLAMDGGPHAETVQLMQEQLEHVVRLVDDLMDVSRIMRSRIDLKKEPVELSAVVRRSVEAIRPVIESSDQEFVIDVPEEPLWLDADPVRLVQVFENLLNNASKYTEAGGRIELTAQRENGEAVICVCDTGVGIEPDLLPHVFDLFTQSSRSLDRAQGGLGIGLTLVKNLVEMHGGRVSARSDGPGCGSQFEVRLPVTEQVAQAEDDGMAKPCVGPQRILVVDDNAGAAWMLSKLVMMLGDHEVEIAHEGNEALQKIRATRPNLVFLDIGLPGLDGFQVAREVRKDSAYDDVFLVALTGYGQEEDRRKSKEAGMDEHLVKPPSIDQLREVFSHPKLVGSSSRIDYPPAAKRRTVSPPPALPKRNAYSGNSHPATLPELDLSMLKHDLGNTAHVLRMLVQILSNPKPGMDVIKYATEGLNQEADTLIRMMSELQAVIDAERN